MNKIYKNLSNKRSRKGAFSLAEVLITLGIIGVVAALTLPNLIQKYQDRVLTSRFKKGYSQISKAWNMVVAEDPYKYLNNGGGVTVNKKPAGCIFPDGTTINSDNRLRDLQAKMKVQKACTGSTVGCWTNSWEKYAPTNFLIPLVGESNTSYSWVTTDGMCFSGGYTNVQVTKNPTSFIAMDTNCNEGPNRLGDDIFQMLLGVDGIVYFVTDSTDGAAPPIHSGLVCPIGEFTVNGRTINFRDRLQK